jgi:WD40 repeat protein
MRLFLLADFSANSLWCQSINGRSPVRPIIQAGPGGTISYLEAFPDGEKLFSVDRDDTVGIWQIDGGWEVIHLPVGNTPAFSGAVSPDGRTVVSGGQDGRVMLWTVADEKVLAQQFHPERGDVSTLVTKIVFSPDGKYYASIGQGQFLKIWNATNGQLVRKIASNIPVHPKNLRGVDFVQWFRVVAGPETMQARESCVTRYL